MSQVQLLLLAYKITTVAVIASTVSFVLVYTKLAPWWRSAIGRTIVWKDIVLVMAFLPVTMSLFFHFSRLTSLVASWIDIADFVAITVIMVIRCRIWIRTYADGQPEIEQDGGGDETALPGVR